MANDSSWTQLKTTQQHNEGVGYGWPLRFLIALDPGSYDHKLQRSR